METKPFIRWVGGKTQLRKALLPHLQVPEGGQYYEPFLGGGAMFFAVNPEKAVLGDVNQSLIHTWNSLDQYPKGLLNRVDDLWEFLKGNPKVHYYELRHQFNQVIDHPVSLQAAALFLVINKTNFNGLYRLNSKGEYNVPFDDSVCKKTGLSKAERIKSGDIRINYTKLRSMSEFLNSKNLTIRSGDYSETCQSAGSGDVIYADPPYAKLSKTSFTKYSCDDFTIEDQIDLAGFMERKAEDGAKVVVSNSAHPDIRKLYLDAGFTIHDVMAKRSINSDPNGRGEVPEIIAVKGT